MNLQAFANAVVIIMAIIGNVGAWMEIFRNDNR